jgi:hypothetical protein
MELWLLIAAKEEMAGVLSLKENNLPSGFFARDFCAFLCTSCSLPWLQLL